MSSESPQANTARVFAYGSNLCVERMLARAPGAVVVAAGVLDGHALRWHKRGRDGSGKCDALATGLAADAVHGVVYALTAEDKAALDGVEGLGVHYFEKPVRIRGGQGRELDALVYVANPARIDERAIPWTWYRDFVVTGARQHGLPGRYVDALERVFAARDPDAAREFRETAVLSSARVR